MCSDRVARPEGTGQPQQRCRPAFAWQVLTPSARPALFALAACLCGEANVQMAASRGDRAAAWHSPHAHRCEGSGRGGSTCCCTAGRGLSTSCSRCSCWTSAAGAITARRRHHADSSRNGSPWQPAHRVARGRGRPPLVRPIVGASGSEHDDIIEDFDTPYDLFDASSSADSMSARPSMSTRRRLRAARAAVRVAQQRGAFLRLLLTPPSSTALTQMGSTGPSEEIVLVQSDFTGLNSALDFPLTAVVDEQGDRSPFSSPVMDSKDRQDATAAAANGGDLDAEFIPEQKQPDELALLKRSRAELLHARAALALQHACLDGSSSTMAFPSLQPTPTPPSRSSPWTRTSSRRSSMTSSVADRCLVVASRLRLPTRG